MQTPYPSLLYIFKKKSSWKNQVRQTGFLVCYELDFYCLCSLQKSIWNWFLPVKNPDSRIWFLKIDPSKIKYKITSNVINQSSLAWIHQNPQFQNNLHRLLQLYNPVRNPSIWGPIHGEFPLGPIRVCSHYQLFEGTSIKNFTNFLWGRLP